MSTISSAIRLLSGAKFLDDDQRTEVADVFHDTKNAGLLDYVACWYHKAADYMAERPDTESAFVSTNSITQGEQVGVLWPELMQLGVRINFAHRTFQWSSAARGKAVVDIAWHAQKRLCARYHQLNMRGKNVKLITTAVARELCGFIWDIAQQVEPVGKQ